VGADKEETMKRKLRKVEAITLFLDTFVDSCHSLIDNKFFARECQVLSSLLGMIADGQADFV